MSILLSALAIAVITMAYTIIRLAKTLREHDEALKMIALWIGVENKGIQDLHRRTRALECECKTDQEASYVGH